MSSYQLTAVSIQRSAIGQQRGLGAIAAIVVLVILAAMAAAIVSVGTTQQVTSAQDVMSARAWQAARAGNEWGLFRARNKQSWGAASCDTAPQAATLTVAGFNVNVSCDSWLYYEGDCDPADPSVSCVVHPTDPTKRVNTVRIYQIRSTACNAAACPAANAAVAGIGYVERTRVVMATN